MAESSRSLVNPLPTRKSHWNRSAAVIQTWVSGHSDKHQWLGKHLFYIDIERCPHCGGQLKLIAAIEEPAAIVRILTLLGLAAQPPPSTPAVRLDLFQAA